MNHSFIQMFDNELDAFRAYARCYPDNCVLLIDTFDCMNSGLKNAIKVFNRIILPLGFRPKGVRIDSGDLTYLSKNIRRELNDVGFPDCDIIVSIHLMSTLSVKCFSMEQEQHIFMRRTSCNSL